jgi:hypothetical protein
VRQSRWHLQLDQPPIGGRPGPGGAADPLGLLAHRRQAVHAAGVGEQRGLSAACCNRLRRGRSGRSEGVGERQLSECIGDRRIEPAVTARPGTIMPSDTEWTVVLDSHRQPVAAIAPGGAQLAEDVVVANAAVPVRDALRSEALAHATARTVVVVRRGESVVGVWAGEDLLHTLLRGVTRGSSMPGDLQLLGRIAKIDITRHCRHAEKGRTCAVVLVVPEKPETMPQCPAQHGIAVHAFEW